MGRSQQDYQDPVCIHLTVAQRKYAAAASKFGSRFGRLKSDYASDGECGCTKRICNYVGEYYDFESAEYALVQFAPSSFGQTGVSC